MWIVDKQTGAVVAEIRDFYYDLLRAAGFWIGIADTPKKMANLRNMVQRQIVAHSRNGKVYYVYALFIDDRVYVGNQAAYQRLQQLAAAKKIAKEQVMAAEMNEATAMDWDAWGDFFYSSRAQDFIGMGEYDQAIADYTKAIEINPSFKEAYFERGFAYDRKGQYDRAIADYTRALEINPKLAKAYNNRGNAYRRKGQYDRAIADYTRALEIKPKYADAYFNRGLAYYSKGQYDRAIADYTRAIELNPWFACAYNNRGMSYIHKGSYDRAIADATKALELNPKSGEFYDTRARAYYHKGNYRQAWEDVQKAQRFWKKVEPKFLDDLRRASERER